MSVMCMEFFKNLFKPAKPIEPGCPSPQETGETAVVIESTGDTTPQAKPYEGVNFHVLLDNGHASSTPGKRQQLDSGKYFFEYEFNRDVVGRIAQKLDDLGIGYEILVPERDEDIPLSTRAARANSFCEKYGKENCFFISVHSNAYGDGITFTSAKGWSVWTTKGSTPADKYATILFNEAAAILPEYGMTTRSDNSDGDPDYEENFTVIYKTICPAVLTENLFFTNRDEVKWLMTNEGRDAIADIHVKGIEKIIKEKK